MKKYNKQRAEHKTLVGRSLKKSTRNQNVKSSVGDDPQKENFLHVDHVLNGERNNSRKDRAVDI